MKRLMPPRFILPILFIIALLITTAPAASIYILYTNNTNGALENCLCPGKSYGSLEKRVLYIREWLEEHPNTVLLDAGDFLSATRNTLKDSMAFRVYELIPYDAVGLGDQEFFRGVNFLSGLMETSDLSFVSTNLAKPNLPRISRELTVTRGGMTLGILSVMDPEIFRFYPQHVTEAVDITPYGEILQDRVTGLRDRVDLLVVLSHLGIDKDRELATSVSGIDIIIGGHTQTILEEPEKLGNTLIVQAGKDGYFVGQLELVFDERKNLESYEGVLVPMDIGLPNDSTAVAMIVEYNRLIRIRSGSRVERISPIPVSFLATSSELCGTCHASELEHWLTTPHASSFQVLKGEHKEKSPDCLVCHTTGFGRDDGYLNYNITAELKNVNCTECHWMPVTHLKEPDHYPSGSIEEVQCIRCHDQENSPLFEFAAFVSKLTHPVKVAKEESRYVLHRVEAGETLWHLAERYLDDGFRWKEIFDLNKGVIENPDMIHVGESLSIPVDAREK
ncbi:MAG: multiheme c-type cytochrome [Candidatus Neomarinimicrobiota bacterium]